MSHIQPDTTLPKTIRIKTYSALITQTSTTAPTVIVLQNTLGADIVWTRTNVGAYLATCTGKFTEDKTTWQIMMPNIFNEGANFAENAYPDSINLFTYSNVETGTLSDGIITKIPITIKVYE